jgi:hypothetical protein
VEGVRIRYFWRVLIRRHATGRLGRVPPEWWERLSAQWWQRPVG